MTCYTGAIAAVPESRRDAYLAHAKTMWPILQRYGARRMLESWGVDIPHGKLNDLWGAVAAEPGEAVVFSWIEWPDETTATAAWTAMESDAALSDLPEMPFDASRMIHGSFVPVVTAGSDRNAAYLQGFALSVPEANRAAYIALAQSAWEKEFQPRGCLGLVEAWGTEVPRGRKTDFWRATRAEAGEMPVISWAAWPDRASCDAASAAMMVDGAPPSPADMPFDGKRMIWGGFDVAYDSDRD